MVPVKGIVLELALAELVVWLCVEVNDIVVKGLTVGLGPIEPVAWLCVEVNVAMVVWVLLEVNCELIAIGVITADELGIAIVDCTKLVNDSWPRICDEEIFTRVEPLLDSVVLIGVTCVDSRNDAEFVMGVVVNGVT